MFCIIEKEQTKEQLKKSPGEKRKKRGRLKIEPQWVMLRIQSHFENTKQPKYQMTSLALSSLLRLTQSEKGEQDANQSSCIVDSGSCAAK